MVGVLLFACLTVLNLWAGVIRYVEALGPRLPRLWMGLLNPSANGDARSPAGARRKPRT